jgi:hypothetical protein
VGGGVRSPRLTSSHRELKDELRGAEAVRSACSGLMQGGDPFIEEQCSQRLEKNPPPPQYANPL